MSQPNDDRLLDLLEKRAFYGLTEAEESELTAFDVGEDISLELTASAITLAEVGAVEPMPGHLRSKIETNADKYFSPDAADTIQTVPAVTKRDPAMGFWNWFGWAVAAAACLALIGNIYLTRVNPPAVAGPTASPTPAPERLTPEQMRERLLASTSDIARANIGPGTVKEWVPSGDIVWSDSKQAGYIHVKGLPKNDPDKQSYQLWIFDQNQDPKTPVDGGVFDVSSDGEVVIPIDAKLKVRGPKVFAITVEKPGGVVISKQEKVAVLAKVET